MNPLWIHWIVSSINKHFYSYKGIYPMFFEGQHRDNNPETLFETRYDGPYFTEQSKDFWKIEVDINILIKSIVKNDLYLNQKMQMQIIPAFTSGLNIYRYNDDDSLFICLRPETRRGGRMYDINNYGLIEPNIDIIQSTIRAKYSAETRS